MSQIDLFLGRCFAILGFCVKFSVCGAKQTLNLLFFTNLPPSTLAFFWLEKRGGNCGSWGPSLSIQHMLTFGMSCL